MRWHYRNTVLASCMAAFFVTMAARLAISPIVPLVTGDFNVSNTQIGIALAGMWVAYATMQFPSGVLADRYGEKRIILVAVGGTAVACLLLASAPVFAIFALCAVLLGGVAGLHYVVATTLLSRTFDDIGTAVGFHGAGATIAGLVAPVAAAWVGVRYGWRPAVALTIVAGIPVFVLVIRGIRRTKPRRPDQPMRERFELQFFRQLLSRPPIAFTVCLAVVATFVMQGILSFLPTFLVEHRGQSTSLAGAVFSAFFVVNSGAQIGVGAVSDQYGRDIVLAGCMIAGTVGLWLFVVGSGVFAVGAAVVLLGVGMSFHPTLLPRFLDEFSEAERGTGFGLVRTTYGILGAAGSIGVGLFADLTTWAVSFSILAVLCGVVFCAVSLNWALDLGY